MAAGLVQKLGRSRHPPPKLCSTGKSGLYVINMSPPSLMPKAREAGSLTFGSMLCLLRVASCYLHLCLYLVPALKAHNPLDMGSVQTAKGGVCVGRQDTCSLSPRERETGLRISLGAEEWVQRLQREENREPEAFPAREEATDLDK